MMNCHFPLFQRKIKTRNLISVLKIYNEKGTPWLSSMIEQKLEYKMSVHVDKRSVANGKKSNCINS